MTLVDASAGVFTLLATGVVAFQLALALGAPWGEYAMGGRFPNRFPASMRIAAVLQALVLVLLAAALLSHAGLAFERWRSYSSPLVWTAVAFSAVSSVLNGVTSSAGERRIWLPVALLMLISSTIVAVAPH